MLLGAVPAAAAADPGLLPGVTLDPLRPLAHELTRKTAPDLVVTLVGTVTVAGDAALPAGLPPLRASGHPSVTIGALAGTILPPGQRAYPQGWDAPALPPAPPAIARQLAEAGFDMLARADDHALDWGIEGMRATDAQLDAAGLVHAGTGESGGLARGARFLDHPAGAGRIALVSVATSYRPTSEALAPQGAAPGRPGVAAIEAGTIRLIPAAQLADLCAIAQRFGGDASCQGSTGFTTLGSRFEQGNFGSRLNLNPLQLQATLGAIRQGKQSADLLVAWIHPGEIFPEALARATAEAGADIVAASGGTPGAIEIHRASGRPPVPIFHDLGRFADEPDGIIVETSWPDGRLTIDIRPIATDPAKARATLERIAKLSAPYGTHIAILPARSGLLGRIEAAEDKR